MSEMKVDYYYKLAGREFAAVQYNERPKMSIFVFKIEEGNAKLEIPMTLDELESIATEMMEWVQEVKEYAEALKEVESA